MKLTLAIFICALCLSGCASNSIQQSSLVATELEKTIELTVPASKVKMTIPRLGLVKREDKSKKSYRYFLYWDREKQLGISGWFEPAIFYKGFESHWNDFLSTWQGSKPTNISFEKVNNWDVVRYNIDIQGCSQSNAKAFLVQNETWLEIHVSAFCKNGAKQADVMGYIRDILVEDKAQ